MSNRKSSTTARDRQRVAWKQKVLSFDAVTGQISEVGPFRAEDNAGDQDESTNQQKGEKIEQHQESQQHKEGLDTAAKVSCGTKVLFN